MLHESLSVLSQIDNLDPQYSNTLISKLHSANLTKTPEGLAIWITAVDLFPNIVLPKGVWNHNDPLSSKERAVVARILKENGNAETGDAGGASQTTPSFAWQVVLTKIYEKTEASTKGKTSDFEKFWIEAVDSRAQYLASLLLSLIVSRWPVFEYC